MNGFLATSRDKQMALQFARNVLFDIEVDCEKHPTLIFADIADTSQFEEEKEVLFDLSTVFRIEKVSIHIMSTQKSRNSIWFPVLKIVDESDSLTCIHLSASSEGRELVDTYLELQRTDMPEFNLVMMFGRLLCFMGEYDKARKHFENLLETSGEDKPSLHHNLALIHDKQQHYSEALQYYNQAGVLLKEADPPRRLELAATFNNMAAVHSQVRRSKVVEFCLFTNEQR